MRKRKVILDVDTGVDDAHALLLALRSPSHYVPTIYGRDGLGNLNPPQAVGLPVTA